MQLVQDGDITKTLKHLVECPNCKALLRITKVDILLSWELENKGKPPMFNIPWNVKCSQCGHTIPTIDPDKPLPEGTNL